MKDNSLQKGRYSCGAAPSLPSSITCRPDPKWPKLWSLYCLFLIYPIRGACQDSTHAAPRIRLVLGLDTRNTFINHRRIGINGALAGITFGRKRHKITAGYYWLNYGSPQRLIIWRNTLPQGINLGYYSKFDLAFASLGYWYPVYRDKKWTVSAPLEIGAGRHRARYSQLTGSPPRGDGLFNFAPCQVGIYSEYRIVSWAGINIQGGYRSAISGKAFRSRFQGAYYSYGISIYPGIAYRALRTHLRERRSFETAQPPAGAPR